MDAVRSLQQLGQLLRWLCNLTFYLAHHSSQLCAQLARRGARPLHLLGMRITARLHQQAATDSRIVLLAADGLQNKQIAAQMGVAPRMIALWRGRFIARA
jgi:FixJ family two-component response regulator